MAEKEIIMNVSNINSMEIQKASVKKVYPGIDFIKLICALLIVYTHTFCWDTGKFGIWIRDEISIIAVPFFFVASGYFYGIGIRNAQNKRKYFLHYCTRIIKMYIIWTILSLPAAWFDLTLSHEEAGIWIKILFLIRSFFFKGSVGVYWFLLALIYNSFIFYVVYMKKIEKILYPLAVILFGVGVLYSASFLSGTLHEKIIHLFFGGTNNFLNIGLFYMAIGYYLSDKVIKIKGTIAGGICIALLVFQTFINTALPFKFFHAFTAVALFVFAHQIECTMIRPFSKRIRKLSTAIYLEHFPFILLFDFYLKRGTLLDFTVTLTFTILLYALISKLLPEKWTNNTYGN